MTAHRQRLLVALVGVPLLLLAVFEAPPLLFGLVVAAGGVGTQAEFYRLQGERLPGPERRLALGLGALLGLAAAVSAAPGASPGGEGALLAAAVGAVLALLLFALLRPGEAPSAAGRSGLLLLGLAYGPLLLAHLTLLRSLSEEGPAWVFLALAAVWGGDSAAYYAGRRWGRRLLYPAVSPRKTWEGAAAGVAGTLAGVAVTRAWLLPGVPAGHVLALGLAAAVFGQLGDLCESLLKRGAGAKDSGALLPGHGGLLDRLDSLLFVAPLVYYYVRALEAYP